MFHISQVWLFDLKSLFIYQFDSSKDLWRRVGLIRYKKTSTAINTKRSFSKEEEENRFTSNLRNLLPFILRLTKRSQSFFKVVVMLVTSVGRTRDQGTLRVVAMALSSIAVLFYLQYFPDILIFLVFYYK